MEGIIKFFNSSRGYGFIGTETTRDVFIHRDEIPENIELMEGTRVSFDTEETPKGLSAKNIKILE
jgi:CspA family cold shock protein